MKLNYLSKLFVRNFIKRNLKFYKIKKIVLETRVKLHYNTKNIIVSEIGKKYKKANFFEHKKYYLL